MSIITEILPEHIKQSEGFETKLYKCPADKWTIGYGFNLEDVGIPQAVADFWLAYNLSQIDREFTRTFQHRPFMKTISHARKAVLIDMIYNMGIGSFMGFRKFLTALDEQDYEKAAEEMLDSKWATQVKGRAVRLSEIIMTGTWG